MSRDAAEKAALREALAAFGKRLASEGFGWEAIITREDPTGETTVAHLTTANPDPDWLDKPGTIPVDAIDAITTLPHITVDRMLGLWVSLDQVVGLLKGWITPSLAPAASETWTHEACGQAFATEDALAEHEPWCTG